MSKSKNSPVGNHKLLEGLPSVQIEREQASNGKNAQHKIGSSKVLGGNGNDLLDGGMTNDQIRGKGGDDQIFGGAGNDKLSGDDGSDRIFGGFGADKLSGGTGHDVLKGGAGNDRLDGGRGDDRIFGGTGHDKLSGDDGRDRMFGGDGRDDLKGGKGNDRMFGGAGEDKLSGGHDNDVLQGGAGNDDVYGGAGNDRAHYWMVSNGDAKDHYEGGKGIDTLALTFSLAEWQANDVQADVANYLQFLSEDVNVDTGLDNSEAFSFEAFGLTAESFEALEVIVDGQNLDPVDDLVVAVDDQFTLSEDALAMVFGSVLANDDVPDLVKSVTLLSGPSAGTFAFSPGSLGAVDGSFSFDPNDVFEDLADGESRDVTFTYEVKDSNGDTDQATATITVTGENDRPVAEAFDTSLGEDHVSVLINASGSDADVTDNLTFKILSAPMDAFGNQYGSVENNGDGTFTFFTGDNFQFLNAGESREMTFAYVAVDDSGTATDTSATQTVMIEVTGSNDAPLILAPPLDGDTFIFATTDQSIFQTGGASIENPDLPFLGGSWDESFSVELVPGASLSLGSIDLGPFGSTPGISISSPSLNLNGSTSGTIGLQPFFSMTGGDIDATIPIGAYFNVPTQVEAGQSFVLSSAFLFGDDSSITTQSSEIEFGVDLVLDLAAQVSLDFSSSSFGNGGSYDIIPSFDISEQINIFTINSGDIGGEIPLSLLFQSIPGIDDFLTLNVAVPNVTTTGGFSEYGVGYDVGPITSTGTAPIASLALDIDEIIAAGLSELTGDTALNISLGFEGGYSFGFDAGVFGSFNLAAFDVMLDLLSSELSTSISLLQDFSLELEDLPLVMILEDGSRITGLSLGDDAIITAPVDFDADVDGDADGYIDFTVDVDMDAVLTTMVSLGFDTTFVLGAIRAIGTVSSDVFTDLAFNAFEGGAAGPADDFLYYESVGLVGEEVVLFEDSFGLGGFEPGSQDSTSEYFDVA